MFDDAVTQKDRMSRVMVNPVGDSRPGCSEVHIPYGVESTGPKISREACFKEGEKSSVYRRWRPYRKPTQVVRKRILRPTGEG